MDNFDYDSRLESRRRELDLDEVKERISELYEKYLARLWADDPMMVLEMLNPVHQKEMLEEVIIRMKDQTEGGKNDVDFSKTYTSDEISYEES